MFRHAAIGGELAQVLYPLHSQCEGSEQEHRWQLITKFNHSIMSFCQKQLPVCTNFLLILPKPKTLGRKQCKCKSIFTLAIPCNTECLLPFILLCSV